MQDLSYESRIYDVHINVGLLYTYEYRIIVCMYAYECWMYHINVGCMLYMYEYNIYCIHTNLS